MRRVKQLLCQDSGYEEINDGGRPPSRLKRKAVVVISGVVVLLTAITTTSVLLSSTNDTTPEDNLTPAPSPEPEITPRLTYSFKPNNRTSGTVVIRNESPFDVEINSIEFVTNTVITTPPQGDLAPSNAQFAMSTTTGNLVGYKLTEPGAISLPSMTSKNFTYVFDRALGPLNIGSMPSGLNVNTNDGNTIPSIADQCSNLFCSPLCQDPFPEKIVAGYYHPHDQQLRQYAITDINPRTLNHLYYGPLSVDQSGNIGIHYTDAGTQLASMMQLKAQYPYLQIILSVGDNTTDAFSAIARSTSLSANFSQNVLQALDIYGFSGVEINWENVKKQEAHNFLGLIQTLQANINNGTSSYDLMITGPARPDAINTLGFYYQTIAPYIDALNVRTYGYNGPWLSKNDYQAPLNLPSNDPNGNSNSINATIGWYQHYKFPMNKTVLGIPTDYVGKKVSTLGYDGIWSSVTGTPDGQFSANGVFDYACAISKICHSTHMLPNDCLYLDAQQAYMGNYSQTPLIKCPSISAVFTGESVASVTIKSNYVLKHGLKGVYLHELAGDLSDDRSLLQAVGQTLSGEPKLQCDQSQMMTETQWHEFVTHLKSTMGYSFIGGIGYTLLFAGVDKMTDKALETLLSKNDISKLNQNGSYYWIKTLVYLSAVYILGSPLLPAAAAKLITDALKQFIDLQQLEATLVGSSTSFLVNIATTTELQNPLAIVMSAVSLLCSLGGAFSLKWLMEKPLTNSFYQSTKKWYQNLNPFGFFQTNEDTDTEQPIYNKPQVLTI